MLKSILRTPRFKRDYKALMRKHYEENAFKAALVALMNEDRDLLGSRFRDHALKGEWEGFRELHIESDWLLIYRIDHDMLQLVLTRTGSHDSLFR